MSLCKRCAHFRNIRIRQCVIDLTRMMPVDGYSVCSDYKPDEYTQHRIMSKLPENPNDISHLIWKHYESKQDGNRPYLGMSQIGEECERKLWYYFRHAEHKKFDGRILALFERGQEEEARINKKLRAIGIKVVETDDDGKQFGFEDHGGHFRGHMDGALSRVPEAPKTWHVAEYKTHSDASFKEVAKHGVEKAKPVHWAQMQCYMGYSGMDRALYVAINKNDDDIYTERVRFDKDAFEKLKDKAARIIAAETPPQRMKEDSSWFECKWCDYHAICHQNKIPATNCRTCARSTPIDGGWSCEKHGAATAVCGDHLYIPALLGTPVDGSDEWVDYGAFINATEAAAEGNAFDGRVVHTSKQLEQCQWLAIAVDEKLEELRDAFAA